MARPSSTSSMTIAQLENLLSSRRSRLNQLVRERRKIEQRLSQIEREISRLSGRAGAGTARARNPQSLVRTMEGILRSAGKPMAVGDIMNAVLKTGYRTTSDNFRGIVNQTLIKEKQFSSAGRGMYQLKKRGNA